MLGTNRAQWVVWVVVDDRDSFGEGRVKQAVFSLHLKCRMEVSEEKCPCFS